MCREKEENENNIYRHTIPTKETHQSNKNIEVPTYYYTLLYMLHYYLCECEKNSIMSPFVIRSIKK